ncbi:hypothetical protein PHSC3_000020 [Chlamydiales bacterium STE3]|nr:hypothetical protein PHSC3_000020 [Chlamydiales bacterium STE3]
MTFRSLALLIPCLFALKCAEPLIASNAHDVEPIYFENSQEESIHWQISDTQEFDWVHPDLEGYTNVESLELLPQLQMYLKANQECYFRYRKFHEGYFGSWSQPEAFKGYSKPAIASSWIKPSTLDDVSWEEVQPFLLPFDHPLKKKLDTIFTKRRATTSFKSMGKSGFICYNLRKWDNIVVAAHVKIKGYIIKTYLDDQVGITEIYELKKRIEGAAAIQNAIKELQFQRFFKVPKKWLYVLPEEPAFVNGHKKHFILIAEDMRLASELSNLSHWKKSLNKERLKALFLLLNHVGLKDSVFISNIPFAKDGKIAFVDTEHYHWWPVPFHRLTRFLNAEMQAYWNLLITTNGNG